MKTHIPISIWILCSLVFVLGILTGAVITFALIQLSVQNALERMNIGDVSINVEFNQTKFVEDLSQLAKEENGTGSCEAP